MNGRKRYTGEVYSFFRSEKRIGKGGNGAVYDIELDNTTSELSLVAKFFEYEGADKERRYDRFRNEIKALRELKDVDGIMKVLDMHCPQSLSKNADEAWYLMPKAAPYKVNRNSNAYQKIQDMLRLAQIIQGIHERGGAHRDIKPENILILNGKLMLSDFGLYWGTDEERLTELNDRIGPYKIMPPELERVQTGLDLDFRPSDVYLFSKVLWMTLKGDNIGYRGQYQRGDVQIYLNKDDFNAITFEPIHKLMEESTFEEMEKRISIQKCIEYMELQCQILKEDKRVYLSDDLMNKLLYDEYTKKIIARSKPDAMVYEDKVTIIKMLSDVIPISNIFVKSLKSDLTLKQIQVNDFHMGESGICSLLYYDNGIKRKEYLMSVKNMSYLNSNSDILLQLDNISSTDEEYIAYSRAQHGLGNVSPRIYFSADEQVVIKGRGLCE
jgi:serine/threonine protein kinase